MSIVAIGISMGSSAKERGGSTTNINLHCRGCVLAERLTTPGSISKFAGPIACNDIHPCSLHENRKPITPAVFGPVAVAPLEEIARFVVR